MIVSLLNTWSLLSVPTLARCEPTALEAALAAADQAFLASDDKAMAVAMSDTRKALACSREPLPPRICARVHRARALAAWLDGDEGSTVGWLRGMLHADPRAELSPEVVSEQHRMRRLLLAAEEQQPSWTEASGNTWLLVDGLRTRAVPVGQPYIVQPIRDDGQTLGARVIDRSRPEGGKGRRHEGQQALRWTSVGLGIASVGLYSGAWVANRGYHTAVEQQDDAHIGSLHTTTNLLSIGSVAAIGLGTGALLSAEFAFR